MDVRTVKDLQDKMQSEELLFSLIEKNDTENFKILLDNVEPKPNIEVKKGDKTPLMKAAMKGNASIKALLEAKADVNLKDKEGQTALDHANGNCKKLLEPETHETTLSSWFSRLFDNSKRPQGYSKVRDQELSQLRP